MNQVAGTPGAARSEGHALPGLLGTPLRIAAAALVLFVVIEVATIPVSDHGFVSDVRLFAEIALAIVFIAALGAAGWRRLRRG